MPRSKDSTSEMIAELSAASPAAMGGVKGRLLSPAEQQKVEIFFGGKLNPSKVRIHANHLPGDWAMVLRNHIFFSKSTYRSDFAATPVDIAALALLVHECAHVWQYQQRVRKYHWYKALVEQIQYGQKAYDYNIDEKDCLIDFRFEQQGAILQYYAHWYFGLGGHPAGALAARYRQVIGCSLPLKGLAKGQNLRSGRTPPPNRRLARY